LVRLPKQSLIPRSVADELLRAPGDDPARRAIENGVFKIIETPPPPAQILAWDLGQGETAVLSYALAHPKWIAVLDDGAARRCARSLSLMITGHWPWCSWQSDMD
jgi:predicted nucleic acid-binding protein